MTTWRAAVDIGSVAAKLLLTDGTERVRCTVDTMLGGTRLSPVGEARAEAIGVEGRDRLEQALIRFRELVDHHRPADLRVVATAPARWPDNAAVLAALVERHLGVALDVLDGPTEARLGFAGARTDAARLAAALMAGGPGTTGGAGPGGPSSGVKVVTIDIGGGSTEFATGWVGDPAGADDGVEAGSVFSVPIGGRSITAAYLGADPPRADELSAALSVIELHVDDVRREAPEVVADLDTAVVIGQGAVATLAAIEVGLVDEDPLSGPGDGPLHGFVLTREAMEDVFRTLATESRRDRAFNPGLPGTRVDEIMGAAAVLVEIMRQLALDRLVVSQRGLLDGLLAARPGA